MKTSLKQIFKINFKIHPFRNICVAREKSAERLGIFLNRNEWWNWKGLLQPSTETSRYIYNRATKRSSSRSVSCRYFVMISILAFLCNIAIWLSDNLFTFFWKLDKYYYFFRLRFDFNSFSYRIIGDQRSQTDIRRTFIVSLLLKVSY